MFVQIDQSCLVIQCHFSINCCSDLRRSVLRLQAFHPQFGILLAPKRLYPSNICQLSVCGCICYKYSNRLLLNFKTCPVIRMRGGERREMEGGRGREGGWDGEGEREMEGGKATRDVGWEGLNEIVVCLESGRNLKQIILMIMISISNSCTLSTTRVVISIIFYFVWLETHL